jgi:hypothetical protein
MRGMVARGITKISGRRLLLLYVLALVACKGNAKTRDAGATVRGDVTANGDAAGDAAAQGDANSYGEDEPFDAAALEVETKAVTLDVPTIDVLAEQQSAHADALVVARVPNGWRLVGAGKLAVDKTRVTIPEGETVVVQQIASKAGPAGVLVVVGAKETAGELAELVFALDGECWALAGVNAGALVGVWSAPCPALGAAPKDKQLAATIEKSRVWVGTRLALDANNAMPEPAKFGEGGAQLATVRAGFASLTFAVGDDVPIERAVSAIVLMQKEVPATHWVPHAWLPMRFPNGFGTDPIPTPVAPPPTALPPLGTSGMQPFKSASFALGPLVLSKKPGLIEEEVSRVVRSRAGVYRACYQKELNRTPGLAGTLNVAFDVDVDGTVLRVTATGGRLNDGVRQCVKSNVIRLKFPPKPTRTSVRARFIFSFS